MKKYKKMRKAKKTMVKFAKEHELELFDIDMAERTSCYELSVTFRLKKGKR